MGANRTEILDWIEQGRVASDAADTALRVAGVTPSPQDWRRFFDQLTLWLGAVFCGLAVIFFFAYNWQAMGRFAKFGMVEALIVAALALCWRLDLARAAGKAALLVAAMLTGALLALVGQTYQTGADTYQLFLVWAICIVPWVLLGRFSALWLFWLVLLNLSAYLYYRTFGGWFGILFDFEKVLWAAFAINTLALVIWESVAHMGVDWLRERWSPRVLAVASGSVITWLALWAIFDSRTAVAGTLLVYGLWLGAVYFYYRHKMIDLFVLAGGVLSAVIVICALLSELMLRGRGEAGAFLFIGMVVLGLSSAGGIWLKNIAREQRA